MPTSRVLLANTSVVKSHPNGTPDILNQFANVKGITSDTFEYWGDGTIWDTATNLPVSVDKFNHTGTPRKRA